MQTWWIGQTVAWVQIIALGIYLIGVPLIFLMHTAMPATFGLAALRSIAWPFWVAFGWPHGVPLPMD